MKRGILVLVGLFCFSAHTTVLSPTSIEVQFSYETEFLTQKTGLAADLATDHASFLFGYMQSPELTVGFAIGKKTPGFGAPAWPPAMQVLSDTMTSGERHIRYSASGVFLMHRTAAARVLHDGGLQMILPSDFDNYYQKGCDWEEGKSSFWYFYDPYIKGCGQLLNSPLAVPVAVKVAAMPAVDESQTADLSALRGDNGNGDLFDVVTINGFADTPARSDQGRTAFNEINSWLDDQGFTKSIKHYKTHPVYTYEKDVKDSSGKMIHLRITRLLADTDLDGSHKTFAKFFKTAIRDADVVLYAGHSGAGTVLEASEIEAIAGPLEFSPAKRQLFFFDACSGYSYYLPLFDGKKSPGTFGALTYGLTSEFGYEHSMHKVFLKMLINFKDDHPKWMDIVSAMEKPLKGKTYLLNYYFN